MRHDFLKLVVLLGFEPALSTGILKSKSMIFWFFEVELNTIKNTAHDPSRDEFDSLPRNKWKEDRVAEQCFRFRSRQKAAHPPS